LSEPAPESDAHLIAKALAGQDSAFALLMARHKGWVYAFIRRYIGNSSDVYDLLQETFFSAWRGLAHYQADRPFSAWLRRIALNKCRDRSRREWVRRAISGWSIDEETSEVPDPSPEPPALLEVDQELQRVNFYLRKLPRGLMEPLLLTALEGLSHKEAGEVLGVNAKAIEMRVYRARARLEALQNRTEPGRRNRKVDT
jgi:RNA polymerase sigma factor (sigma-70 family)